MKKLLVLMLVLGIASLASAGLHMVVSYTDGTAYDGAEIYVGDSLHIDIVADAYQGAYVMDTALLIGDGSISGGTADTSGNVSGVNNLIIMNTLESAGWDSAGQDGYAITFALIDGFWMTEKTFVDDVVLQATAAGSYTLSWVEGELNETTELIEQTGVLQTATINVATPEPATMVLLGLGALVLRRKK